MKVFPFDYMVQSGEAFCPKCSHVMCDSESVERTACNGIEYTLGRILRRCPKIDHFHRQCPHCKGMWIESAFDDSERGALTALHAAFECAERADFSEEDLVDEWRDRQVRIVMLN